MIRRSSFESTRRMSEINMTPLMDLTFILLITFIITFPLVEQGVPLNLPQGEAPKLSPDVSQRISIDANENVYLNDSLISVEDLTETMEALGKADPDTVVYVRGDESLRYGRVVEVLVILQEAGISRMALLTEPE
jgi:biopolymer transport protein TolR